MFTVQLSLVISSGQGRIRTSVARKERQIYSLLPLTTRPPVHSHYRAPLSQRQLPRPGAPTQAPSKTILPKEAETLERISPAGNLTLAEPIWSGRRESNPRPTAWKAVTLPLSYSRWYVTSGADDRN